MTVYVVTPSGPQMSGHEPWAFTKSANLEVHILAFYKSRLREIRNGRQHFYAEQFSTPDSCGLELYPVVLVHTHSGKDKESTKERCLPLLGGEAALEEPKRVHHRPRELVRSMLWPM